MLISINLNVSWYLDLNNKRVIILCKKKKEATFCKWISIQNIIFQSIQTSSTTCLMVNTGAVSCDTHLSIIVESTNYRPKFVQSGNGSKRKEREREREKIIIIDRISSIGNPQVYKPIIVDHLMPGCT